MEKNDLTALYGLDARRRNNDMRPRFDDKTYTDVLEIAMQTGIKRNVVVMAIVKLWLSENRGASAEEKLQRLLRIATAA